MRTRYARQVQFQHFDQRLQDLEQRSPTLFTIYCVGIVIAICGFIFGFSGVFDYFTGQR